jgi:hypothetical protein
MNNNHKPSTSKLNKFRSTRVATTANARVVLPDEPWVVTCTAIYNDQREDKGNDNIRWIDVESHETFVICRWSRVDCEYYVTDFKGLKVRDGKLVKSSSLIIGPQRHWDEFMEQTFGLDLTVNAREETNNMSNDEFDEEDMVLDLPPGTVVTNVPSEKQKKRQKKQEEDFTIITLAMLKLLNVTSAQTLRLAMLILYLHWKGNGDAIKLSNTLPKEFNISRESKRRALIDLERRGFITVERQSRKTPTVKLAIKSRRKPASTS